MEKEYKLLPLFISLSAGLVASILLLVHRRGSLTSLIIILAVLLVFYIIGLIFRSVLTALKTPEADDAEEPGEIEGGDDEISNVKSQEENGDEEEQQE